MSFCTECGQNLEAGDRFCGNCGQKVEEPTQSTQRAQTNERAPISAKKTKEKTGLVAEVPSHVRIAPLYGDTFDPDVHCFNCGAKRGASKNCPTCGEA